MNRRTGEAKMLRGARWSIVPGLLLMASPALAQSETTTYTYDALGRLVGSTVANGQNNGVRTVIAYDPAGNRKTYTVSGAPNAGTNDPDGGSSVPHRATFVVVPLNGYTLIPIH